MPMDVALIEEKIGYHFKKEQLLIDALTHSSYANECKVVSYERLEFLGDAVLEFIVSDYLYKAKSEYKEGQLTKLRSSLVCEYTLSQCSKEMNLGEYVRLSKGERITGGKERPSILCDLFESVLGAIYLDGGVRAAKKYVTSKLLDDVDGKSLFYDAKTKLQEIIQQDGTKTVSYQLIEATGPDHDREFLTAVLVDDKELARGVGRSIKGAEQMAAYQALLQMKKDK